MLCKKKDGFIRKATTKIKEKIFWNTFIRYSLQSYLKLVFAYFSAVGTLDWGSSLTVGQSCIVLLVVALLVILPMFYGYLLKANLMNLREETVIQKMGSLHLGIRNFSIQQALNSVVFLIRRIIFILLILTLMD